MKKKIIDLIQTGEEQNIVMAQQLAIGQNLVGEVLEHYRSSFELLKGLKAITEKKLNFKAAREIVTLDVLNCSYYSLTTLDLSNNTALELVNCYDNPYLKKLILPKGYKGRLMKDDHTKVVYK